jgi:hypothetical protein
MRLARAHGKPVGRRQRRKKLAEQDVVVLRRVRQRVQDQLRRPEPVAQAQLKIYSAQMDAVGGSSQINIQQGSGTFSAIITTVEALNAAKVLPAGRHHRHQHAEGAEELPGVPGT